MQLSTEIRHNYSLERSREYEQRYNLLARLQAWLEGEDSFLDKAVGYGICSLTFIFLFLQVVRAFN